MRKPRRRKRGSRTVKADRGTAGHVNYYWLAANRMAFSNSTSLIVEWNRIPGSGETKFDNFVEQQISPESPANGIPAVDDSFLDSYIAGGNFKYLNWNIPQLWNGLHENRPSGVSRRDGIEEIELTTFTRAVYSRAQLLEVMVDFWHNHFNSWGWDYWSQPVWPHYDAMLRTNAFGNFRSLLGQVAAHPAMLYYLDQYTSSDDGPNENFARELFELHTMGSDAYYGVIPKSEVPTDGTGLPLGYVDEDVYEAARCFTGWTVNNGSGTSNNGLDNGTFFFNLSMHDKGLKRVLDLEMPAGTRGELDGLDVLDALAQHPATGRFVAKKLCKRLVSDDPPQSLVDAAAAEFTQWWFANDQIKRVVRLILKSDEFKSTQGEKGKRPFETIIGAIRTSSTFFQFYDGADDLSSLFWRYENTGQPLFSWPAPDGYPDERSKWESSTPKVMSWRLVNWMSNIKQPNGAYRMDVLRSHVSETAVQFADFWINRVLARPMNAQDREAIIDFVAAGSSANNPLNKGNSDTASRLRSAVALIINSPYFHER